MLPQSVAAGETNWTRCPRLQFVRCSSIFWETESVPIILRPGSGSQFTVDGASITTRPGASAACSTRQNNACYVCANYPFDVGVQGKECTHASVAKAFRALAAFWKLFLFVHNDFQMNQFEPVSIQQPVASGLTESSSGILAVPPANLKPST